MGCPAERLDAYLMVHSVQSKSLSQGAAKVTGGSGRGRVCLRVEQNLWIVGSDRKC